MKNNLRKAKGLASALGLAGCLAFASHSLSQTKSPVTPHYKVLSPVRQQNLTIYPVVADISFDTGNFLTLEEGIRSGEVIVTEASQPTGLIRPRYSDGIWRERPVAPVRQGSGARVNELAIINHSDRPLVLLAGEIVVGGKQDRVVSTDRIIPAHSAPIALGVFCVEPHRWTQTSAQFGALRSSMAQPSVRLKAMAEANQQEVWNEVAKSRAAFAAVAPAAAAQSLQSNSSYAGAMQNDAVKRQLDSIAVPIEQSYNKLLSQLRAEKAIGAVVAVNREIIWADVFASSGLLEKYWLKLIRSYAAEALSFGVKPVSAPFPATQEAAQHFLDHLDARHETVETEPGLYQNTEIKGEDFDAFVMKSLLPGTGFNVHIAKMKR